MTDFFADTYAVLAFLAGDDAYGKRLAPGGFHTGLLNLYEVHAAQLAANVHPEEIQRNLAPFEAVVLAPDWPLLREASQLRAELVRRRVRLSYADAAGYVQARRAGFPFLTGDPVFEGLEGVQFLPEPRPGRGR